jgi:hypothetical protein
MKTTLRTIIPLAIIFCLSAYLFTKESKNIIEVIDIPVLDEVINATEESNNNIPVNNPTNIPIKNPGLKIGEKYNYGEITIWPLSVEQDSRCPVDVVCIQAGTVVLKVAVTFGDPSANAIGNNEVHLVTLGEVTKIHGVNVLLTSVNPPANSMIKLTENDYSFTFDVSGKFVSTSQAEGKCYVGGCSSEICSDTEGVVSNCMYKEEYACYQTAKCERQSTGQCGWTQTSEVTMCLQNAQ